MIISHITEIKDDSSILYYRLNEDGSYRLISSSFEKINKLAEMIKESYGEEEGFELYYGSLQKREEETNCYLFIEQKEELRYEHGNWEDMYRFSSKNESIMSTIIPLYTTQISKQEEESDMNQSVKSAKSVFTGLEIITEAKPGELFAAVTRPEIITRREDGVFISNQTKKEVVMNNEFLQTAFVRYEEPKAETKEQKFLTLEEALKAYMSGEHIHAKVTLPNGDIHESVCFNQFLPIADIMQDVQENEGMLGTLEFISEFQRAANEDDEEALSLVDIHNARIPVEVLVYGQFFIENDEEPSFF